VDTAFSGLEALDMVQETKYDIIFMDHMMPMMDGVDATRLIRELPGEYYKNVPIIALTANVVGDVRSMFLECGMNDFLAKPLDYKEIERVFKEWLPSEKWS
jgi:CheY-like chemotaxis protein